MLFETQKTLTEVFLLICMDKMVDKVLMMCDISNMDCCNNDVVVFSGCHFYQLLLRQDVDQR